MKYYSEKEIKAVICDCDHCWMKIREIEPKTIDELQKFIELTKEESKETFNTMVDFYDE